MRRVITAQAPMISSVNFPIVLTLVFVYYYTGFMKFWWHTPRIHCRRAREMYRDVSEVSFKTTVAASASLVKWKKKGTAPWFIARRPPFGLDLLAVAAAVFYARSPSIRNFDDSIHTENVKAFKTIRH
jgi:hypothetical protein